MAKMTADDATRLLLTAAQLAAQLTGLIPTLLGNLQAIRDGLENDNADDLNDQIVAAHARVQEWDAQLQALHS